ncbi:Glycogenin [Brachionus plicatilis]|uniref:glycogenin glucosyltransferase n=1 Tax=Brachionus plicatilis TaxID=10195 RepID=A0A3M7SDN3_BRAPC|nr:Glycogenin [Brachionus plicatilis]
MNVARVHDQSYVTLATNENYALGALTLGSSLRNSNTNRSLTVLITSQVPSPLVDQLRTVFDLVELVDVLDSNDSANLALLKRPELGVTFTKLHCWRLVQFSKCVFLDSDCLVVKNSDDLFDNDEFTAVTDIGWPDCFNSGVFVFRPSLQTYSSLLTYAVQQGSFDGGDQGLLNSFFPNWKRASFVYNMTTNASYSYAPAYKQFKDSVRIVHFIGAQKPWYHSYNLDSGSVMGNVTVHESELINQWWKVFVDNVLPGLNEETVSRMSVQLVSRKPVSVSVPVQQEQVVEAAQPQAYHEPAPSAPTGKVVGGVEVGSEVHQQKWQHGQIEYTGRDAFSNIQAHLDAQLKK